AKPSRHRRRIQPQTFTILDRSRQPHFLLQLQAHGQQSLPDRRRFLPPHSRNQHHAASSPHAKEQNPRKPNLHQPRKRSRRQKGTTRGRLRRCSAVQVQDRLLRRRGGSFFHGRTRRGRRAAQHHERRHWRHCHGRQR